jgi:hypothetical protein
MFRIYDWSFSSTAEVAIAVLLVAAVVAALVL